MAAPLKVEFHFDFGSPNAYLAELALPGIEKRTGVKFEYVPILLGGIFKATAGKARLLAPDDFDPAWNPATDDRVSDWEVCVRLAKALSEDGVPRAAALMAGSGHRVDLDTVKELSYLLFSLAEKKSWASTALLFNSLGTSWSDIEAAARTSAPSSADAQATLSFDTGEE